MTSLVTGTPRFRTQLRTASLHHATKFRRLPVLRLRICARTHTIEIQSSMDAFGVWLEAQPGCATPYERGVHAATIPGFGNTLVASRPVARGEPLLNLPREIVLDPQRAMDESVLGSRLAAANLSEQCVLAAFLADLAGTVQRGEHHEWAPYLAVLPQSTGSVLGWDAEERAALLQGTSVERAARELADQVDQATDLVCEVAPELGRDHVKWGFEVLFSRLIRLQGLGDALALVPFADFLNHSPDSAAFIDYDAGKQRVVLVPERSYAQGEQVFVSYGEKSSAELLLTYGFVPPAGTNPHNFVNVEVSLDPEDALYEAKLAVLQQYGQGQRMNFPVRMAGMPTSLLPAIAFCGLRNIPAEQVAVAGAEAFGSRSKIGTNLGGLAGELLAREWFNAELRNLQGGYPGTLEEDKALAREQIFDKGGRTRKTPDLRKYCPGDLNRQMNAAMVRLCERQILARTQNVTYSELKAIRKRSATTTEGSNLNPQRLAGWAKGIFGGKT
eukprot:CAMPEP_0114288172 /NCGR_PEP_ID=MMETSP0059-20121206/6669_1 /TAXON_ID=36894 /ORGANISM="Pyramimonas parkeae, Strain CCMP726" /LENGTH=500 /DNA_ID=CAMNT_0001409301 /DNA_START=38 /DNA_END=1540 /DNA_ORIENTATION=+